jgi:hypothetical protein
MTIGDLKIAGLALLLWGPWPILGVIAQHQRGGHVGHGFLLGLLLGPLGLLVANYSGGYACPYCFKRGLNKKATRCPKCGGAITLG